MTFAARPYDDIVRDMLTTLTGGTVREPVLVPKGTLLMPKLKSHPVRRVSCAEGQVSVTVTVPDPADPSKKKKEDQLRPWRFTAADFELVSTTGKDDDKDAIRFREKGRKPVPGTDLVVNYYPVRTDPVPLTDLSVGSVIRTILETIGVELALTYQLIEHAYRSAFVETAEGDALDKVVALVGVRRIPSGRPVAKLRFARRAGTGGAVTIPAASPVTDAKGNRYLTIADATMEPGEATRDVTAAAESSSTAEVGEGELRFLEVAVEGISEVTNPDAARKLSAGETDDALRFRARGALRATVHGTVDAIRFGLLSVEGVKEVTVTERPNGVPGEVRVDVAYADDSAEVKAVVAKRLEELRPAGIVVTTGEAARLAVSVDVTLTLTGASLSAAELQSVKDGVSKRLDQALKAVPPGGRVRRAQLTAAAMGDSRVIDARVTLTCAGQPPVEELQVPQGSVLDVASPFRYAAPLFERADTTTVTSTVSVSLPLNLVGTTSPAEAQPRIEAAVASHLSTRSAEAPLTFDGLAAALRDDSRYALVRAEALVTVEGQGAFRQLSDGLGSYAPAANERLVKGTVTLDVRGNV